MYLYINVSKKYLTKMLKMYLSKMYPIRILQKCIKIVSYKNISKKYLTVQKTFTYIRLSGFSTICDDISGKKS